MHRKRNAPALLTSKHAETQLSNTQFRANYTPVSPRSPIHLGLMCQKKRLRRTSALRRSAIHLDDHLYLCMHFLCVAVYTVCNLICCYYCHFHCLLLRFSVLYVLAENLACSDILHTTFH